MQEDAAKAI